MTDSVIIDFIDPSIGQVGDLDIAFRKIELALQRELSDCYAKLNDLGKQPSISLLESIAQIQCAIDIIHSADTHEQREQVYSILKEIRAA